MVATGQFFFRYRNALFPVVFVLIVPLIRSQALFGSRSITWCLGVMGALIACAGEALRLATIGFRYIERGGRKGQVYAGRLVRRGVYGPRAIPCMSAT